MSVVAYHQPTIALPAAAAPRPHLSLRPYQHEALEAVTGAPARGISRPLVALPTGAGKTILFSALAGQRGGRALILAHRDELIQQAADKLRWTIPGAQVGVVKAERNETSAPIVVASVQTLARHSRLRRLPTRWDTVIIDEAHHVEAESYQRVLEWCGSFERDDTLTLGVTATPERADGKPLGNTFQEIVYQKTILDLILAGYLVDLTAIQVRLKAEFSFRVRGGDYVDSDVEAALLDANAPEHVVSAYQEHASDRKALLFTPTVKMAYEMAGAFNAAGIAAAAIDGGTDPDIRRATLARFRQGEIRVLANCAVLTEGYDEPSVGCVIIARPTKSRPLYVQMIGRGTRKHPGKETCIVLDLVGASDAHDLMTVANLFDLDAAELDGASVAEAVERKARAAGVEQQELPSTGQLISEHVDLFRRHRLHWLQVDPARFILPLGDDLLWLEHRDAAWDVVRRSTRGPAVATTVAEQLTLEWAQGVAEDIAREAKARALTDPAAAWRNTPASERQLEALRRWKVAIPAGLTKGEASDLMTLAVARRARP
jgi:superfamily II DNA or RNA helicase